ncbi:pantoate--beta-alanine ligase [Flavobacteriaceae bacterium]|jgi:pantoate--beta-alanine ligase|nr:pantoate--beta-alanine ligase [Flavobacteriales bacterium]MBL6878144.1 pantoate--beta-alanine ligase [Flavobacteriaceae bacterium]MDA9551040.1 pantoate--beta-alanine ligase [Flavobacteriaceae bacterium]MDA9849661.1 pantoate--beta-alanine ligase [Flavobacteriaceae bacterium]MDB2599415.1 pantoate--beta-alanine ligase [Flavobacteriaceae bacterium]
MKIFYNKLELIEHLNQLRKLGISIGFVPTMGALHKGHLSLLKKSSSNNKVSVVSIFINPTQFNSSSDLSTYPNNLKEDCSLLKSISEEVLVFAPDSKEIYGNKMYVKSFNFKGLDKFMEGEFRNNHFQGVATVVELLLDIVKPDRAYFGEKDFQQLQIIKSLKTNIKIIGCETQREKSGLALSSRNNKLSSKSKKVASNIFKSLTFLKSNISNYNIKDLTNTVIDNINSFDQMNLEYLIIADEDKLVPTDSINFKKKYRAFISVFVDGIRLIDNIALN